jgi:mannose-6-phosphate isomerase-like protein (cupin superfamily)
MKHEQLQFRSGFRLSVGKPRSQGAVMVIPPGDSEGGPDNSHRGSDQWLYIVEGTGAAIVNGHRYPLTPGVLMLIARGDVHELTATGRKPLKTINIYVPPAFQDEETPLSAGMPGWSRLRLSDLTAGSPSRSAGALPRRITPCYARHSS